MTADCPSADLNTRPHTHLPHREALRRDSCTKATRNVDREVNVRKTCHAASRESDQTWQLSPPSGRRRGGVQLSQMPGHGTCRRPGRERGGSNRRLRSSRPPIPARLDGAGRCCKATAESALHMGLARMRAMTPMFSAPARSGQSDSLPPSPGRPPKTGSRIGSGQGLPCRGAQQCRR